MNPLAGTFLPSFPSPSCLVDDVLPIANVTLSSVCQIRLSDPNFAPPTNCIRSLSHCGYLDLPDGWSLCVDCGCDLCCTSCPRVLAVGSVSPSPNSISVPLTLNGHRFLVLYDTGASVISSSVLLSLGMSPVPGTATALRLADEDVVVSSPGLSPVIELHISGAVGQPPRTIQCQFRVLNLDVPLLGMDLHSRLGFKIVGIPSDFPDSCRDITPDPPARAACPLEQPPSGEEATALKTALESSLAANDATRRKFCTHLDAVVHLDTGDASPSYVRQYKVPQSMEHHFDAFVAKCLRMCIIGPAPAGCEWNSPLLAVRKKDEAGNYTKVRICIDPRHVNGKLKGDSFTIPILRDIFDALSGSDTFSTLDLENSYHQFPINEPDRVKTAFTWRNQQYVFYGAPFGFKP
eukprot:Lithocolla_globosa_v1_NODE_8_length_11455_cov_155.660175.p2 type:complete len:406 gc:universal NODE_8_length_11455_cov_155.660175:4058-5275(+)